MNNRIIGDKSFELALAALEFYEALIKAKVPVIPNQFLKSATSVGANVEEAYGTQTDRDFLAKLLIARKEAREVHYWLRLVQQGKKIESSETVRLLSLSDELIRMLTSATKKLQEKINNKK